MGGRITVERAEEQGDRFTIPLPEADRRSRHRRREACWLDRKAVMIVAPPASIVAALVAPARRLGRTRERGRRYRDGPPAFVGESMGRGRRRPRARTPRSTNVGNGTAAAVANVVLVTPHDRDELAALRDAGLHRVPGEAGAGDVACGAFRHWLIHAVRRDRPGPGSLRRRAAEPGAACRREPRDPGRRGQRDQRAARSRAAGTGSDIGRRAGRDRRAGGRHAQRAAREAGAPYDLRPDGPGAHAGDARTASRRRAASAQPSSRRAARARRSWRSPPMRSATIATPCLASGMDGFLTKPLDHERLGRLLQ